MRSLQLLLPLLAVVAVVASTQSTSPLHYMKTLQYRSNLRLTPFSILPQPNYAMVEGATVVIEQGGFAAGMDQLFVDYQGDYDIRGSFNQAIGVLTLSGTAPISEYAVAISSVVFMTTAEDGATREITYTFGKNTFYMSSTRHFYEFVTPTTSESNVLWEDALSACKARSYLTAGTTGGSNGYLATITGDNEMTSIGSVTQGRYWLGGMKSVENNQNVWRWVSGPEGAENNGAGRPFWIGASQYLGGMLATPTAFARWMRFQPDNGAGNSGTTGEKYLQLTPSQEVGYAYFSDASNQGTVAGYVCEYGRPSEDTTMYPLYTDAVLLTLDCSLFDVTECNNRQDLGCVYNGGSCSNSACDMLTTQATCAGNWMCNWNTESSLGSCVSSSCSKFGTQDTCTSPDCTYRNDNGAVKCVTAKCSDLSGSAAACTSKSDCMWEGICVNQAVVDCNGFDTVFMLDGSVDMAEQFGKYTSGFFALTQMLIDADLGLMSSSAVSFGQRVGFVQYGGSKALLATSGGTITSSRTQADNDLRWHQAAYSASLTTRDAKAGLSAALSMFQAASGTRTRNLVIFSAGGIDDAVSMATDPNSPLAALKALNVKIGGVALRPTEPDTTASLLARSSLLNMTTAVIDVTMADALTRAIYGVCSVSDGTVGQLMGATHQKNNCNDYTDRIGCNKIETCSWDDADAVCSIAGCMVRNTGQTMCEADSSCRFDTTLKACIQKCPSMDSTSCPTTAGCTWDATNNFCATASCVSNPNEDACIADPAGCVYDPSKPTPCTANVCPTYTNSAACLATSACTWTKSCFANTCGLLNQAGCVNAPQCTWDSSTAKCGFNTCGALQGEVDCGKNARCLWNVGISPARCTPAPCLFVNASATTGDARGICLQDSQCYWQTQAENGNTDLCVVKTCEMNRRSCDCANMDGCVWRDGQCKNSAFVQCPAADLVFLVESTPKMMQSFGRHPSGFLGTVEAIRSWSRTAPLSPNSETTGFRLGLVGFGGSTTAMTAPTDIGAMGKLTGDVTAFADLNGEVDGFEAQLASYTANVGSDNGIMGGITEVQKRFASATSTITRKKILVILGAQPITDGSDELGTKIAELEASGVRIFSNVLRRFSEVSMSEDTAAASLRPLATDPSTTYFSFNTIETFQDSILNSFCDPSTNTGAALQISRDGTLPCNWLSGSTECGVQPSCMYNATALKTCPLAGQCPNLDCAALPTSLASKFECRNCEIVSGVFKCSLSNTFNTPIGTCSVSPCMTANCNNQTCDANAACGWSYNSSRCERKMCTATTQADCNADLGCVWADTNSDIQTGTGRPAGCSMSRCGKMREATTCNNFIVGTSYRPCAYDETQSPAICKEARCASLDATACQDPSMKAICSYDALNPGLIKCLDRKCQYGTNQLCEMDSNCYWNPFDKTCNLRGSPCVLSAYSNFSAPTATCGPDVVYYRSRTVLQIPDENGASCIEIAKTMATGTDDTTIVQTKKASELPGWPMDCKVHCSGLSTAKQCVDDISCEWNNQTCIPNGFTSCESLSTEAKCSASDMCGWDATIAFCVPQMKNCTQTTPQECATQSNCVWRVGTVPNALALSLGGAAQLINPTQKRIFVFPNVLTDVANSDTIMINGATVTIEGNFQRGKDVLAIAFPAPVTSKFLPASGTLLITGEASLREYLEAIRFVTFFTSSMRQSGVSRTITWALGTSTVYSSVTQHYYTYHADAGVTWEDARAMCQNKALNGMQGYLVTVNSEAENDLISSKLGSDGAWISGDDYTAGVWSYSSGPEKGKAFWNGGSVTNGGFASPGMYGNWNSLEGEPLSSTTTYRHPFLNMSGFWSTKGDNATDATGYICEYGGMDGDSATVSYPTGGVVVVGISGCVPSTPCGIHTTMGSCEIDNECSWKNGVCVEGCNVRSTVSECQTSATGSCSWDVKIMPPVCDVNPCANRGQTDCSSLAQCKWTDAGCAAQTGCAQYLIASECDAYESCIWSATQDGGQCDTRSCETIRTEDGCGRVPTCSWSTTLGCTTVLCKFSEESLCSADSRCTWLANSGTAAGFMASQGSAIFDATTMQRPSDISTPIAGVLITISEGFQSGADVLVVEPKDTTQTWLSSYNSATGVLSLTVAPGATTTPYDAFGFIQKNIKFYTSSRTSVARLVTYTLSAKTIYSASTKSYLRNPPNVLARTRAEAVQACMSNTYMGFAGKLASITSQTDNMMLKSAGISGWIAASSDGTSNQWTWGSTSVFWTGAGSLGAPTAGGYAQWAIGEPRAGGVAAVMTQTGTWRAYNSDILSIGQPVICQYGDSTSSPQLLYGERSVKPIGCFATPCVTLGRSQCDQAASCVWNVDKCESDTFCQVARDPASCNIRERCFWDYDIGTCRTSEKTFCSSIRNALCFDYPQCEWRDNITQRDPPGRGGACGAPGCGINPVKSACEADSTCRWDVGSGSDDGKCVSRLCGYRSADQCWADAYCQYDYTTNLCGKSDCYGKSDCSGRCSSGPDDSQPGTQVCYMNRCSAPTLKECHLDPDCLFTGGQCTKPSCASNVEESACTADTKCYFTYDPIRCAVSQCVAYTDMATCTKTTSATPNCMWDGGRCRDLTWLERNAPETTGSCEKEEDPSLWWLWLLLAILIIVLALIVWRLYLAYAKNMSFFEPPRRNVKYSPHQQYAADLFEDAQEEAVETNHVEQHNEDDDAQERPSLNDL